MMSWLDFFRSKKETRKVEFQNLNSEVEAEIEDARKRIKNIKEKIRQRMLQLNSEFEGQIGTLKNIDLKERKEHERIKFIVTENLKAYISHLQNLKDELKSLNPADSNYLEKINTLFENFKRGSINSFQKATILIGKELENVVNSINSFFKDVERIITEDKEVFRIEEKADILKNILLKFEEEKKNKIQIKDYLQNLEQNLKDLEEKKGKAEKSLEDAKNSTEYSKFLEEREEAEKERGRMQREIFSMKQEIDIKAMLKQFHSDKKKSRIIKGYAEDFNVALGNDETLEIAGIIQEAKPEFNAERLRELRLEFIKLKSWQETLIEKQLKKIEENIKKIDAEISEVQNMANEERKKGERLEKKTDETKGEIKKQAKILWENIEISD